MFPFVWHLSHGLLASSLFVKRFRINLRQDTHEMVVRLRSLFFEGWKCRYPMFCILIEAEQQD